jgi:hypothetical protein
MWEEVKDRKILDCNVKQENRIKFPFRTSEHELQGLGQEAWKMARGDG